jgi:hypothetical protein
MPDMLCSLVRLPRIEPLLEKLGSEGIVIRRPNPWEQTEVRQFIGSTLRGDGRRRHSGFFAPTHHLLRRLEGQEIIGFAAYDAPGRIISVPTGVDETYRGKALGRRCSGPVSRGFRIWAMSIASSATRGRSIFTARKRVR